jgi:uncharacterized protein (DUF302 family)
MPEENATSTYLIAEPFDRGVRLVRKALSQANLSIAGELNLAGRVQRALLIHTAPCVILFACLPTATECFPSDPVQTAFSPLHVVVSARGSQTEVHILRVLPRDGENGNSRIVGTLAALKDRIAEAIESVGMRASLAG